MMGTVPARLPIQRRQLLELSVQNQDIFKAVDYWKIIRQKSISTIGVDMTQEIRRDILAAGIKRVHRILPSCQSDNVYFLIFNL